MYSILSALNDLDHVDLQSLELPVEDLHRRVMSPRAAGDEAGYDSDASDAPIRNPFGVVSGVVGGKCDDKDDAQAGAGGNDRSLADADGDSDADSLTSKTAGPRRSTLPADSDEVIHRVRRVCAVIAPPLRC